MQFSLKNAPATLQRVMDKGLKELNNDKCLTDLDDVIVLSTVTKNIYKFSNSILIA